MDQSIQQEKTGYLDFIKYQQEYKYITIFLSRTKSTIQKKFKCINCGSTIFRYYCDIRLIFEGVVMEIGSPIDCSCKRCKIIYKII